MSEPGATPEGRARLLAIARRAIEARLAGEPRPSEELDESLRAARGAFVTLKTRADHALRGCVGYVEPHFPVAETVQRAAVSAAVEDGRFLPVSPEELDSLSLEISILSPLTPIRPEDVSVGTHGLLLRHEGRSGLLLPQVPLEHGWDRETFLEHTCLKAGLMPETWKKEGVELMGFTANVFGEA